MTTDSLTVGGVLLLLLQPWCRDAHAQSTSSLPPQTTGMGDPMQPGLAGNHSEFAGTDSILTPIVVAPQLGAKVLRPLASPPTPVPTTVCGQVTIPAQGSGGLSNTVGYINTALHFALEQGLGFVFPPLHPTTHKGYDKYANFFAADAAYHRVLSHYQKQRRLVLATCHSPALRSLPHVWQVGDRGVVALDNGTHYGIAQQSASVYCFPWEYALPDFRCPKGPLVVLPLQKTGTFHFNFTLTRRSLQAAYSRMHPRQAAGTADAADAAFRVAMHVRLGDVAVAAMQRYKWKYTAPPYFVAAAGLLTQCLPVTCVTLTVYTDQPQHRDISTIQRDLSSRHNLTLRVARNSARAAADKQARDFQSMAVAHVLLASKSGYSRLAAVMSQGVVVAPAVASNPLERLQGIVSVDPQQLLERPEAYAGVLEEALRRRYPKKYSRCLEGGRKRTRDRR